MANTVEKSFVVSSALVFIASTIAGISTYKEEDYQTLVFNTPLSNSVFSSVANPTTSLLKNSNLYVATFNSAPINSRLTNAELGRRLLEIRNRAISGGLKLLSLDEINVEVSKLRGDRNTGDV